MRVKSSKLLYCVNNNVIFSRNNELWLGESIYLFFYLPCSVFRLYTHDGESGSARCDLRFFELTKYTTHLTDSAPTAKTGNKAVYTRGRGKGVHVNRNTSRRYLIASRNLITTSTTWKLRQDPRGRGSTSNFLFFFGPFAVTAAPE